MLTVLSLFLKAKSILNTLYSFILAHWQAFLVLAMLGAIYHYKSAYESEKTAFTAYKNEQKAEHDKQVLANKITQNAVKIQIDSVIADHAQALKDANLNREKVTNKLKGSINEIQNSLTIANSAIELRNSATGRDMPNLSENPAGLTEAIRNCNSSLTTIKDAALVTDYDYEALYSAWDRQCKLMACE